MTLGLDGKGVEEKKKKSWRLRRKNNKYAHNGKENETIYEK